MIKMTEPIPAGFDLKEVVPEGDSVAVYAKALTADKLSIQALFPQTGILGSLVTVVFHQIADDLKQLDLHYYTPQNQQAALEYVRSRFPKAFRNATPQANQPAFGQNVSGGTEGILPTYTERPKEPTDVSKADRE